MQGRRLTRTDCVLGLVALVWMVVEDLSWDTGATTAVQVATGVATVAPVVLVRRLPVAVGLWITAGIVIRYLLDAQPFENAMPFGATLAVAYFAARSAADGAAAARRVLLALGPYFVVEIARQPSRGASDVVLTFVFLACAWAVGNAIRVRWLETRALRRDREALERTRTAALRSALAEERSRLAGELRVIVTAASARGRAAAEAAARALDARDGEAAERYLAEAQQASQTTSEDLRRLLRVLRTSPPADDAAPAILDTTSQRVVDRLVVVGPTVAFTVVGLVDGTAGNHPEKAWPLVVLCAVVPALAFLLRGRRPLLAALLAVGLFALLTATGLTSALSFSSWSLTGMAGWICGRHHGGRRGLAAAVAAFVPLWILTSAEPAAGPVDVFFVTLWALSATIAGFGLRRRELEAQRTRRWHAEALEARARDLEAALNAERRAIARDMHDVVGHALTLLALHAGAARRYVLRDLDAAAAHVEIVRQAAADAAVELDRLLHTIGAGGRQPGLHDLRALVDRAGARLETSVVHDVPDSVGLAAYRIVQEALTNAHKHAPGADVTVAVRSGAGTVELEVRNGPARRRHDPALGSGGHGLDGMAERARLFSGTFVAGRAADGGWTVRATLPVGGVPVPAHAPAAEHAFADVAG